ncbi:hypothetical protein [Nocardia tengchongensis]|uniref:hypothetical protein n=1 Tax=Nocardia tengchongensis TaxID=2055889 RepID=UPI003616032A
MWSEYQSLVSSLNKLLGQMQALDEKLPPLAKQTSTVSQNAQAAVNQIIQNINDSAGTVPPADMDENLWVMKFLNDAHSAVEGTLQQANDGIKPQQAAANDLATQMKGLQDAIDALKNGQQNAQDALSALQAKAPAGAGTPGAPASNADDAAKLLSTLGLDSPTKTPGDPGTPGTLGTPAAPSPATPEGTPSANPLNNPAINTSDTPTQAGLTQSGSNSPSTSGLGDMGSLIALQDLMGQRDNANQDPYGRDPYSEQQMPEGPMPLQAAPVTPQSPVTTPATPGNSPTGPQQVTPVGNNPATQPAVPSAMPTPAADGSVPFTFYDGKTQQVSPTVWQALDAAFHDPAVLDARQAYAKTSAKWSDDKKIGDSKDPSELMTGDVVTWQDPEKTAIVRRLDGSNPDTDQVEVIVDRLIQILADEMSDSAGSFKGFAGFARPRGIELDRTSPGAAVTGPATDASPADGPAAAMTT